MEQILAIFRVPELRKRVGITFLLLFIYRMGFQIPLPGVDLAGIQAASEKIAGGSWGAIFGIMNAFTVEDMWWTAGGELGIVGGTPYLYGQKLFQQKLAYTIQL